MGKTTAEENTDPYPREFDAAKVRGGVDPEMPNTQGFDGMLKKLDREEGPEKGGC